MKCNNFFCPDYITYGNEHCRRNTIFWYFKVENCKQRKAFNRFWKYLLAPLNHMTFVRDNLIEIKKGLTK